MKGFTQGGAEDPADFFSSRVRREVGDILTDIGQDLLDRIEQRLSIAYPPSSLPGEDPHRRSGNLMNGNSYSIELDTISENSISLLISNKMFYAVFLRDGTSKMAARDCYSPEWAVDYLFNRVLPKLEEGLSERFS